MSFPKTFDELINSGFVFSGQNFCRGCGRRIEWWITPKKKPIPLDVMIEKDAPVVPHYASCTYIEKFRKPRRGKIADAPEIKESGD